jgi:DHA2 family multidrug resistance protein
LAAFATFLPRLETGARHALAAHVVAGSPRVGERLALIGRGFAARGLDPGTAREAAGRVLEAVVVRQAAVIAFERIFLLAGIAFLAILPLVLFLKAPTGAPAPKVDLH